MQETWLALHLTFPSSLTSSQEAVLEIWVKTQFFNVLPRLCMVVNIPDPHMLNAINTSKTSFLNISIHPLEGSATTVVKH